MIKYRKMYLQLLINLFNLFSIGQPGQNILVACDIQYTYSSNLSDLETAGLRTN